MGTSLLIQACHTEEDMIGQVNWIVSGNFTQPLHRPATVGGNVQLTAQTIQATMAGGTTTPVLSYQGELLGPTIEAMSGETVQVLLQNNLSEHTNIHWHGLVLPEDMDGHPRDVFEAGSSYIYSLPIQQRAGTYWYHPHPHGATAKQVFMGLCGMFIVRDSEEMALNLPSGFDEIPVIIQDKRFTGAALDYSPTPDEIMTGYLCEHITVNGVYSPLAAVCKGWTRLRVLNGSTARVYNLGLSNGDSLHIIGSDGGLLATPRSVASLMLGPGERADVMVNFSALSIGQEVHLVSHKFTEFGQQGRQYFSILKFVVEREATSVNTLPATLSNLPVLSAATAIRTRRFDISLLVEGTGPMGSHSINGKVFEMERVDETVEAGTTEIWEFDNAKGDEIHPMHIHGVQFQVLDRTGGRGQLTAAEYGWKDTILVMPFERVSVIMTFPSYTGTFVFHCHNLEHEDDGMMLNYRII